MKACIIIPARIGSTRLPLKALADINGKSMISRVYEECAAQKEFDVFVATDDLKIKDQVEKSGGRAILTESSIESGTDRIYAALLQIDPCGAFYSHIINVQGDIPNIKFSVISQMYEALKKTEADIITPVVLIENKAHAEKANIVKAIISFKDENYGRALYFTRSLAPYGEGNLYEHIGIYAYTRDALKKFVSLPRSNLEKRESLEQLRALEADMKIYVKVIQERFISVDTLEDLEIARQVIK